MFFASSFPAILIVPLVYKNARVLTWGIPAFAIVAGAVSLESFVASDLPRWLLALGDARIRSISSHGFVLPAFGPLFARVVSTGVSTEALTIILCLSVSSIVGSVFSP
jgi:hypothetical protein